MPLNITLFQVSTETFRVCGEASRWQAEYKRYMTMCSLMSKSMVGKYVSSFSTGLGQTHPDPSKDITLPDGVVVPKGKGVDSNITNSSLLYNECHLYMCGCVLQALCSVLTNSNFIMYCIPWLFGRIYKKLLQITQELKSIHIVKKWLLSSHTNHIGLLDPVSIF